MGRAQLSGALLDRNGHSIPAAGAGEFRPRLTIILGLIVLLFASRAEAQPAPLDCARATEGVQRTICRGPRLKLLDTEVARSYEALRGSLIAGGAAALQEDQTAFLAARERGPGTAADITLRLRARRDFLASVRTDIPGGFVGTWRNLLGQLTVKPSGVDSFAVTLETADPVNARWTCKLDGVGRRRAGTIVVDSDARGAAWSVKLTQRNRMIMVEQTRPERGRDPAFCQKDGSVDGSYFPVRAR